MILNDTEKTMIGILKKLGYKKVEPDSDLRNDLMIDSIKLMMIIVEVEENFSIDSFKIVENIENIIKVSDLVEAINQVRGINDGD
mgnify:CR=1 FL=1